MSIDAPSQGPGTNTGHGHVWKRPDRMIARCGGPGLCGRCKDDSEWWGSESDRVERLVVQNDLLRTELSAVRAESDRLGATLVSLLSEFGQDVHDDRLIDSWSATLTGAEMEKLRKWLRVPW